MDPLTAGMIAAPVIGGIFGAGAASDANKQAEEMRRAALAQYLGIDVPTIEDQRLQLTLPEYLQDFNAQTESAIAQGPSSMEGVAADPRLQEAQMAALQQLADIGQTGMTPAEAAALRTSRRQAAGEAEAKSKQILQEMQRRGVAGSGMELASRLQAAQSSADRQSAENDRVMQMAQARALQGITQGASLAGQVRGQQVNEQTDIARARDAINNFNTQNQQQVQQRNVGAGNQANLRNLQERQRIAEARGSTQNQEQQYNKELAQKQFQNRMQKANAVAGQYGSSAQAAQQAGANQGQMYGQIGSGVGTILGGLRKSDDVSWSDFGE